MSVLTRENVLSNSSRIKLCDQDDNLELYCYVNCSSEDEEIIKRTRGVVFDKVSSELVFSGFSFTEEFEENEHQRIKDNLSNFSRYRFFKSYEGCLLRLFYYSNKWYVSTTRKLDAYKSKWASKKSFGELFDDSLRYQMKKENVLSDISPFEWLTKQLDTSNQYMFLLLNDMENRIVCKYSEDKLYHVGTFNKDREFVFESNISIPQPEELSFDSLEHLISYVSSIDHYQLQGVVIFDLENSNRQYKILNSEYNRLYKLRNNEPSIKFRYLQLRLDFDLNEAFCLLYPEHVEEFEEYENLLFNAGMFIYKSYVNRYIKGEHVVVPVEEFQVMKQVHEYYKSNILTNKVNYTTVIEFLNKQNPSNLNKIIKHIKFGIKQDITPNNKHKRLL